MKALIFGTILFDLIDGKEYIGGCSCNVASHCGKLGAFTTHLSRVGADRLGDLSLSHFAGLGVDTSHIVRDPEHATGYVDVVVDDAGQPRYTLSTDAAYDYIAFSEDRIDALAAAGYDFLYFGTVDQRAPVSAATLRKLVDRCGCRWIFCDINLRKDCYTRDSVEYSLRSANILKLNKDELSQVVELLALPCAGKTYDEEEYARCAMERYGLEIVVVTRSEEGAAAYTRDGRVESPARKVKVHDSVGAGDAFSAAFILQFIATNDLTRALASGNALGGYVASHRGSVPFFADYPADLVAGLALRDAAP